MPRHPNSAKKASSLLDLDGEEARPAMEKLFKRRRLDSNNELALELSERATHESILAWNDRGKEVSKGMIMDEFLSVYALYAEELSLGDVAPKFWTGGGADNWFHRFLSAYNVNRKGLKWALPPETVRSRMINWLATQEWCRLNLEENALVVNLDEVPTYSLMRYGKSYCGEGKENLNTVSNLPHSHNLPLCILINATAFVAQCVSNSA